VVGLEGIGAVAGPGLESASRLPLGPGLPVSRPGLGIWQTAGPDASPAAATLSFQNQPPPAPVPAGQLQADVLAKVKRATVYIRVTLPDGNVAQGSGFFGVEHGLVLTNAH